MNECVYFLRRLNDGLIKIGYTTQLEARLSSIRTGAGPCELLASISGDTEVEREHHERFAHLRADGEWFRPEPDLLTYIAAINAVQREADARAKRPPFLSITATAKALGISRAHAHNLATAGEIPVVHLGRRRLVPARWLDEVAAGAVEAWRAKAAS